MIKYKAGDLNKRIQLKHRIRAANTFGGRTESFSTTATVWAHVQIGTGREFFAAQKVNNELSGIIIIRYRTDVREDMVLTYNGKDYDIKAVLDIEERRVFLRLEIKEIV